MTCDIYFLWWVWKEIIQFNLSEALLCNILPIYSTEFFGDSEQHCVIDICFKDCRFQRLLSLNLPKICFLYFQAYIIYKRALRLLFFFFDWQGTNLIVVCLHRYFNTKWTLYCKEKNSTLKFILRRYLHRTRKP